MRVCFVAPRAQAFDGWGRYTTGLVRAMREQPGIEPVLATADATVDAELAGVERHAVLPDLFARRFETPRSLTTAPRLHRVTATCEIVHGIAEPYLPLLALARRRHQGLVLTAHGTWAVAPFEASGLRRAAHAFALRQVDLLVCQSRFTCDRMAALVQLPPHVVLAGGVRADDFQGPIESALPDWVGGGPLVLSVGSVKPRKGVHVTLEAAAIARRLHPNLRLVVAGPCDRSSGYVAQLGRQAEHLGMRDAFHLLGAVPFRELVAWYRAADAFALLPVSDHKAFEGLGLVYLEAGAAGTPSIGTDGSGAAEAILDGRTGFVVRQNDPEAAAAALLRLLNDDALRARMGDAARERARTLSWTRLAAELADRYRDIHRRRTGLLPSRI
jgi:phosphatidylinositol alpha-1,6-mannosyltransferase